MFKFTFIFNYKSNFKKMSFSLYILLKGLFENRRAHVSADDPLDVCDYCTNTEAKLHILYRGIFKTVFYYMIV